MEAVLDAERLDRADSVAHSTGATIAVRFAVAHAERVRKMVLIEPTLITVWSETTFLALTPEGDERKAGEELLDDAMTMIVGAGWRESISGRALERLLAQAPMIRAHGLAHRRGHYEDEGLARVTAPTLLLYGDYDDPMQQEVFDAIGRLRPDMERRRVAGAGHNVHSDQPEAVNAVIREFFGRSTPLQ